MSVTQGNIVIIDDSKEVLSLLEEILKDQNFKVYPFESALKFLAQLKNPSLENKDLNYDLVVSDVLMPGMSGMDFLRIMKQTAPEVPVVLMTAHTNSEDALLAIREGAYDYIPKPSDDISQFKVVIERALKFRTLKKENILLKGELQSSWQNMGGIVGKSQAMKNIFDIITRISHSAANVLISGESGTGKELVAKAIHYNSPRSSKNFLAINCSAIPENLLESELFGHIKGSFTGATRDKKGLFEEAQGGTLFLDEIGDMNILLQAKLLRVLQEQKIKPVGGNTFKDIDVRIISATHKNLPEECQKKNFREDLYFRLNVIPVNLPPLRERREDIPILADHFLNKFRALYGSRILDFSPQAMKKLYENSWRGNVRELENTIERAVVLSSGPTIEENDIPLFNQKDDSSQKQTVSEEKTNFFETLPQTFPSLSDMESLYVEWILKKMNGDTNHAASILGISPRTLYRKRKKD